MTNKLRDVFNVEVIRNAETGVVLSEFWLLNSKPHSLNDRPAIIHYDEKGRITDQIWMKNGIIHREGAPARVKIDPETNVIYQESWLLETGFSREGQKPVHIQRNRVTGRVTAQRRLTAKGELGPFRYFGEQRKPDRS